jgi:hypothetical protein
MTHANYPNSSIYAANRKSMNKFSKAYLIRIKRLYISHVSLLSLLKVVEGSGITNI